MITQTETSIANQDTTLNKQVLWKQCVGDLPEIDISLNHTCFGSSFGVYTICTEILSDGAIIYSFGVGKDISFEKGLHNTISCNIHLFDPTPASITWMMKQHLPDDFSFHPYGISNKDQFIHLFPPSNPERTSHSIIKHKWASDNAIHVPAKTLSTIISELNHNHIDVLKMDIEGTEYDVIENLYNTNTRPGQLIIEFHHHYPEIGIKKTATAIKQLRSMGYKLFSYSKKLEEFSFIFLQ